jgi:3-phenylpropionate/trans-cinnamate dioxygenase ferredoxin subunit
MSKTRIEAGNIQEIKQGTMKRISTPAQAILVCNVEGQFYAIDDLCTHEDFSLSYGCIKGDLVQCSLHGARFNIKTGQPVVEPAEIPLQTYPVTIENEKIFVEV